jgi:hypothetical protein
MRAMGRANAQSGLHKNPGFAISLGLKKNIRAAFVEARRNIPMTARPLTS